MKKAITLLLTLAATLSITACGDKQESSSQPESSISTETTDSSTESSTAETIQLQTAAPTKLTNKMTETELQFTKKHGLTLLDELEKPSADPNAEHTVSIEFMTIDIDKSRAYYEENHDSITDEEYNNEMKKLQKIEEAGGEYRIPYYVLVDGYLLPFSIPD